MANEQITINIPDLLTQLKAAYDRMSVQNSHKALLGQAAGVIIGLMQENIRLRESPAPIVPDTALVASNLA